MASARGFLSRDSTSGAALATGRRALGVLSIHDDALARDALTYTSFVARRAHGEKNRCGDTQ